VIGNLLAGVYGDLAPLGDYESIATATVGSGGAANIEFTSIPSTFQHLQLRGIIRGDRSDTVSFIKVQANSDTANNYANHGILGNGSSASVYAITTTDHAVRAEIPAASATASIFAGLYCDILDYQNTNKNKTFRALTGNDRNGAGQVRFLSGVWLNTSAITSLKIIDGNGNNFVQHSSFALYGIKG
jgi:hypothetical protein